MWVVRCVTVYSTLRERMRSSARRGSWQGARVRTTVYATAPGDKRLSSLSMSFVMKVSLRLPGGLGVANHLDSNNLELTSSSYGPMVQGHALTLHTYSTCCGNCTATVRTVNWALQLISPFSHHTCPSLRTFPTSLALLALQSKTHGHRFRGP